MTRRDPILQSVRTVAVIGASRDREKFGNKAVRAFSSTGFTVFPINSHCGTDSVGKFKIEGLHVYGSILAIPEHVDLATMYLPPKIGENLVEDIFRKSIRRLWINPGAESDLLVERCRNRGIETELLCSIVAIGANPMDYE